MPDLWANVDENLAEVPINIAPLVDDTDFKSIEAGLTYDQAGLDLLWNFVTTAGAFTQTAVVPTEAAGAYDWTNQGNGYYTIEIPASGGGTINNDTEGFGWFSGVATGVLPWRGPTIGFRRAALNDLLIDGGTASTNLEDFFDGTGYAGGTTKQIVDLNTTQGAITWGKQIISAEADNDGALRIENTHATAGDGVLITGQRYGVQLTTGGGAGASSAGAQLTAFNGVVMRLDGLGYVDHTLLIDGSQAEPISINGNIEVGDYGGNITGSVGSLAAQAKADVNAEVVDALTVDVVADSIPADGDRTTIAQAAYMLVQFMNERSLTGTTLTVNKADGITALYTLTLNNAVSPTSVTRAT